VFWSLLSFFISTIVLLIVAYGEMNDLFTFSKRSFFLNQFPFFPFFATSIPRLLIFVILVKKPYVIFLTNQKQKHNIIDQSTIA